MSDQTPPPDGAPAVPPAAAPPVPPAATPAVAAPAAVAPAVPPPPTLPPTLPPGAGGSGYFKSGKAMTIGLIVAGVVAVGALGGIVGLVLGGDGDGDAPAPAPTQQPQAGSGVLNPAPVGSTDPATPTDPAEPSESASPSPTEAPSPQPAPEPAPEPAPPSGDSVTIGGSVQVFVPAGWDVGGQGETDVSLGDAHGNFVYAVVGTVKPSANASAVLSNSLDNVLPQDLYTQLQTSEIYPGSPYGSVTSVASLDYVATWADPQAAIPLYGRLFAVVRQDGTALIITAEHTPPDEFDANLDALAAVVDPTLTAFGG